MIETRVLRLDEAKAELAILNGHLCVMLHLLMEECAMVSSCLHLQLLKCNYATSFFPSLEFCNLVAVFGLNTDNSVDVVKILSTVGTLGVVVRDKRRCIA
jgi:hypothetical protein